jgi:hypothetical protein
MTTVFDPAVGPHLLRVIPRTCQPGRSRAIVMVRSTNWAQVCAISITDHRVSFSGQAADCAVRAMPTTNIAAVLRPSEIAAIIATTPLATGTDEGKVPTRLRTG